MLSIGLSMLVALGGSVPVESQGGDVKVVVRNVAGEQIEEYFGLDASGKWRLILTSATSPNIKVAPRGSRASAIQGEQSGLFSEPPSFRFTEAKVDATGLITLTAKTTTYTITKTIDPPRSGNEVGINVKCDFVGSEPPRIRYLLDSYAFAAGIPDTTFAPAFRPGDNQVTADHFFRSPAVTAQKGALCASLIPDLDVLKENRPMPTIIDLDCKNGVVNAPLLSYGFCDARLVGHVYFANDASMMKRVPFELRLGSNLLIDAKAPARAGYEKAADYLWKRYGSKYYNEVLPQAMTFGDYANVCYPAAFSEAYGANKLGWFEQEIDGQKCGGIPSGWGFTEGWVSWQCWFNQLRSAWGLRWWGQRMQTPDWVQKADKMLNLALAAPMDRGACPTTYLSREKAWKGSLIAPRSDVYYDLTNIAWKGIWMLRWLEFPDCPRRTEIEKQCKEMADCMVSYQNADGSFPTWLTKEMKVVPILDHSAQSALPCWFLAMMADRLKGATAYRSSAINGSKFLLKEVVDQQRYYDFETFFSCSPKRCLQVNGLVDDLKMHDPHTLQPPQNTLCMQWTAEALRSTIKISNPSEEGKLTKGMMQALTIMNFYQNVWPISYRKVAYTYGGFGVQNSDGEYNDARQAQFGETLCDFGAALGRQDLFERGVAATRASLTLINHPLHANNGIYPNPNYPLGLQPENDGHGGSDQQNGRTGFDWGEGSGLASMALLVDKYGDAFDAGSWRVGLNGVVPGKGGNWLSKLLTDSASSRSIEVRKGDLNSKSKAMALPRMVSSSLAFVQGQWRATADTVGGMAETAHFVFQGGKSYSATCLLDGSTAHWTAVMPDFQANKDLRFVATMDGNTVSFNVQTDKVDPNFDFSDWRMAGWAVDGDFAEVPTWSRRMNFGLRGPFIGTCEDGKGGFDDRFQGTILSPIFMTSKPKMTILVGGGDGKGVSVELLDVDSKAVLFTERGRNQERMDQRTWDLSKLKGRRLQIRIIDQETGGWGHINVGKIAFVG